MIELLVAALIPSVVFGSLLWRADRRFDLAQQAWRLERVGLLNRIQQPGIIPVQDQPEPTGELLHVPYDDDTAHDEYMEDRAAGLVR